MMMVMNIVEYIDAVWANERSQLAHPIHIFQGLSR